MAFEDEASKPCRFCVSPDVSNDIGVAVLVVVFCAAAWEDEVAPTRKTLCPAACWFVVPPLIWTSVVNKTARPLICGGWRRAAFISRLNILPLFVDPSRTAAGCGSSGGGSAALGTGRIPRACRAGRDVTGIVRGILTRVAGLAVESWPVVACVVTVVGVEVPGWDVDCAVGALAVGVGGLA